MLKKIVSVLLLGALCCLAGCGTAAVQSASEPVSTVVPEPNLMFTATFSSGETVSFADGDDLVFFIQCNASATLGTPKDGEDGAGVIAGGGTVSYSDVILNAYGQVTSEKVTITNIFGDISVTLVPSAMVSHSIFFDDDDIRDAIEYADMIADELAASGEPSGEACAEP